MRRVMALATLVALALPAAAEDAPAPFVTVTPPASVPAPVLDAAQRLSPSRSLEAPLRSAVCAFAPIARHLEPLPSNLPWAQIQAVVIFAGLPGLEPGQRAAVLRPTRELLARAATRERIAEGDITLHDFDLTRLPDDAPTPAFLAIHVAPPETPPEGCVAQAPHASGPADDRARLRFAESAPDRLGGRFGGPFPPHGPRPALPPQARLHRGPPPGEPPGGYGPGRAFLPDARGRPWPY